MIALVRRNLAYSVSKQNPSLCKSYVSLSLLLRSFSSSPEREVVSTAAVYDVLVNKHHFPPEFASAVSSDLNRFRSPEKADSILTFLESNSFSSPQLQRLLKSYPRMLTASNEEPIKLKINILKDFGFAPAEIAKILCKNNAILYSSAEKKIVPQLSTLRNLLGSNEEVVELVKRSVWYMTVDLEKIFLPNVELLKSCGVTMEGIRTLLCHFPRCLLVKPEIMRETVEKAKAIGVNQGSKTFVYAVRAIASLKKESWELKLRGFREMGVSEREVMEMFRKAPTVLCTSLEKLREIRKLLLATGRYEMCDLVSDPTTLMCSVERRYKPRLRILEMLEKRELIEKWPALSTICRCTDEKFFEAFVRPYAHELGEVYVTKDCLKMKQRSKH